MPSAPPRPARPRAAESGGRIDVAELHAPFTHQEILLREALRLGGGVDVNPSGGALCGNPMFAAGLARIGMAAQAIMSGRAGRALGHATSGPALQQNLVCVMEAAMKQQAAVLGVGQTRHRSRRTDVSIAGLCREAVGPRAGGRPPRAAQTSTRSWSGRRPTCSRA